MKIHTPEELSQMGLLPKDESISTELVFLRHTERRTDLFTKLGNDNKEDEIVAGVEWAKENAPTSNGIRCNANITLAMVGAKIPASGSRAVKEVDPVLIYPYDALAEWGNKFLTSSLVKYKGGNKVLISEPSKMKIDTFFKFLPKMVYDTRNAIASKFVTDYLADNPGLAVGQVTIKWILMRCNMALDNRGDIEEHTAHTHGVNINEIERESTIKVNDTEVLVLAKATNICELPTERRRQVLDSWFGALAATGAITDVEGKDNAKIQHHKAGNFLTVLKGAIGTDLTSPSDSQL